jgi:serine protease
MTSIRNIPHPVKTKNHKHLLLILQAGIVLALVFGDSGLTISNAQDLGKQNSEMFQTDQVVIKYKESLNGNKPVDPASASQILTVSQAAGVPLTYLREMSGEVQVYRLPARMSSAAVQAVIDRLMKLPEVEYAEPDIIMQHTLTPDDPLYSIQWHYWAPTAGNYGINAPAAWDITTGSANIVVAVVDTGITNHTEFAGRTVPGYDFISDLLVANDGDGRDSNPSDPGDWITAEENAAGFFQGCAVGDSSWHGTHTAGTIGAASNNGVGVTGINWNSKILPVRVLGKCGGYMTDIIDGMLWAAGLTVTGVPANANPARVINLSLGGSGVCGTTLQTAINSINTAGTTVVVSAGNSNANASGFTPANCNGVITVAATNRAGRKASYSNYGATVEISAPGGDGNYTDFVVSTWNLGTTVPGDEGYAYMAGTSMAAPHVSGVASLLYSLKPSLTPSQVLAILQNTATPFPTGSNCNTTRCGSGIVNAGAALTSLPTAVDLFSFTATGTNSSVILNWETATEIDNLGFNLYRSETPGGERIRVNPELIASSAPGSATGASYEYTDTGVRDGIAYYYWLEELDIYGRLTLHGPAQAQAPVDPPDPLPRLFLPAILWND